ncbi:sensor histidine kinase [Alteribacillus sp. JSM 102045]|uniref:sensor histidine kinase n=1 Tax=Alteribacillus sp. JSM 102045 TaxID=1562101 RepID=UPI0035C058B0
MIILVILLWLMGSILFLTNPKNEKVRWASLIGFFGGFGGLGTILSLDDTGWLLFLDNLFTSIGHYWTPYAVLIFGIMFSGILRTNKQKRAFKFVFLLPVILMYLTYPVYPEFETNHFTLSLWVVPYVMVANMLLIYAGWQETRPTIKKQKIITCLVVVPPLSFALVSNIILEAVGVSNVWRYNPWIIALQFLLFTYFVIKYGFLGVQVRFEKQRRDSTLKAVTSGTSLLNHTIKNEIAKIDILVYRLKEQVPPDNKTSKSIDLMLNSTNHLIELSQRIQSKLDIIELKETDFWLSDTVDAAVRLIQPSLHSNFKVIKQFDLDVKLYADPVHLQESFLNIMKNALDAMEDKGKLVIKVYKSRKKMFIDFTDNGKGIEKGQVVKVLDPFYSTKGKAGNYGLGLTYCFNVMQMHGGEILVQSKKDKGTTITLSLPSKRMIQTQTDTSWERITYAQNQGYDS